MICLAIVALVAATLLTSPGASESGARPRVRLLTHKLALAVGSGSLVFAQSRQSVSAIFVMNGDGSRLTRMTTGPQDTAPAWSPNGTKIAFLRNEDLLVMNRDGRGLRLLARGTGWFSWAPDSRRLAFTTSKAVNVIAANGANRRRLASADPYPDLPPQWSPDGTRIAYDAGFNIAVVSPNGGTPLQLPAITGAFTWSPDGRRIAFASDGLSLMDADGSNLVRITAMPIGGKSLDWSRDGTKITFSNQVLGQWPRIWVVSVTDGKPTALTGPRCSGETPRWAPDSRRIVFIREHCNRSRNGVVIVNADGTGLRWLAHAGPYAGAHWDPTDRPITGSPPRPARTGSYVRTFIHFPSGRIAGFVTRHNNEKRWYSSWIEEHLGVLGALVAESPGFATYCADGRDRRGYARQLSATEWAVTYYPRFRRAGVVRRRGRDRWEIYDTRGRILASTRGPDDVPAGLAWLTLRYCD